ncbi:hypothetical protein H7Y29_01830 [Microbacteriaceae bacterium]|nr:hypothetical protein [Candidatus Saccharibacteria bacterium]
MTELDFDELDKAVSTIMSGIDTSKRKEGFDDPEDKIVEIPPSIDIPSPQPSVSTGLNTDADNDTVVSPAAKSPVQEIKASEPLAVKRRGQFMDVMHSSSNMKTMAAPRREGVSLRPPSPFVSSRPASSPKDEPMSTVPTETPVVDVITPLDAEPATGAATSTEQSNDAIQQAWPDPIDVAEEAELTSDNDNDGIVDAAQENDNMVPEDILNEVGAPETEQPINSPFLAGAKVEKRPLGTATQFPESVATPDTPQLAPVAPSSEPLPAELNTDVMALESSSTPVTEKVPEPTSENAPAPEVTKSTIPGSIPQQYTEQPSTGDVSNSAIYDTSTHHQPLDNGVKKSSPMKWVILALVLLIVGALAGAAYFYFKTQ